MVFFFFFWRGAVGDGAKRSDRGLKLGHWDCLLGLVVLAFGLRSWNGGHGKDGTQIDWGFIEFAVAHSRRQRLGWLDRIDYVFLGRDGWIPGELEALFDRIAFLYGIESDYYSANVRQLLRISCSSPNPICTYTQTNANANAQR